MCFSHSGIGGAGLSVEQSMWRSRVCALYLALLVSQYNETRSNYAPKVRGFFSLTTALKPPFQRSRRLFLSFAENTSHSLSACEYSPRRNKKMSQHLGHACMNDTSYKLLVTSILEICPRMHTCDHVDQGVHHTQVFMSTLRQIRSPFPLQ